MITQSNLLTRGLSSNGF